MGETDGRISAERLLPEARAAGFTGSDHRSLRRGVGGEGGLAAAGVPAVGARPGQQLLIDYGLVWEGSNRGSVVDVIRRRLPRPRCTLATMSFGGDFPHEGPWVLVPTLDPGGDRFGSIRFSRS